MINRLTQYLNPFKEVSIAPLIIFRVIFGALMLFGSSRFIFKGWVNDLYIEPQHFFGYLGFEWVHPLPGNWMYIPFVLMILASIGLILGLFYRFSAFLLFFAFTYIELLDKSNYLNHYYFVSLMCFLMILLPANRRLSIDALINPSIKRDTTYAWHIGILKFQLGIVYFFAGVAKLHSDWLFDAQPLKIWLQAHHNLPIFGGLLESDWVAYLFSWFGCIYDLTIPFFLLSSLTRPFAYFFVVAFHIITWYLFPIGVFPWVMICSTLIFFSPEFHQRILLRLEHVFNAKPLQSKPLFHNRFKKLTSVFLVIYLSFQILTPFRYLLYPSPKDLFWHEEGFRFSWRVMLMHKEGHATFYLVDPDSGRQSEIINSDFLTQTQEDQMSTQPDMILQYARIIHSHYAGKTLTHGNQTFKIDNPEVHAEVFVSLNGRPSQLFVDKKHNLLDYEYDLNHRAWIEPFKR